METVFHSSLVVLCILYTVLVMVYARIFVRGSEGMARFAGPILLGTVLLHFGTVVLRGMMVKACPLSTPAEFLALLAFSTSLTYAVLEARIRVRTTGVFAILPAFLLQVIATVRILGADAPVESRIGVLRSFYNFSSIVALSAVALCAVYGLLYLFLYGAIKGGRFGLFYRKMPSLEKLADLNLVATALAFFGLSFSLGMGLWSLLQQARPGSGALRGEIALTAGLWVLYGGALLARRVFGLGGKRLAYTTVVGSVIVLVVLLVGVYGDGFHG